LQIRDGLSESLGPEYPRKSPAVEALKPYPMGMRVVAVVLAWLIPGAGHFVLGKWVFHSTAGCTPQWPMPLLCSTWT
jgi:hypothetical protein